MTENNTAPAGSMPHSPSIWDTLPREKREKVVRQALKRRDVDTLVELTMHNLLAYGRGGAHTSVHTMRAYRTGVRAYLAYALPLGWKRLTEHDTDLTIGYIRTLERQGVKPGTINARRSAARALYRALRWAGVLHADPFSDTPRAQDREDRWVKREAYSRADVDALLALADPDETRFLLLGAHGALRMAELISLEWKDVNFEKRTMTVTGKGRKTATVHLSSPLVTALEQVPAPERVGTVLPWQNPKTIRLVLRALCHRAGVQYTKRQVHGLRHAAATMLLDQCGDIYVVARHLRHSSVGTTETYAKLNNRRLTDALATWDDAADSAAD
ncbi:tyrosine-type recombinase/integrase [Deinococcus sp. 6YEL10]|uniref:tyrosine-type recombinase/integrase n=1 Tax=Deinococcus sp. 6YEL10 TaxID=2745870 RepID=UPI001E2F72AE|nr:tyrosine-type recombinase/integrase [Deinococcus sp. 6YEL10]MCD0160270.1 tyrosine-type recombinase/integrase [Deinococcus sp. 6YEL10]